MAIRVRKLKYHVAAIFMFAAMPAFAQGLSETELLEQLRSAEQGDAMRIEQELLILWSRSGSDSMDLLLERGRRALGDGETELAIEHFTALTDHAPEFAEGWNARATAYFQAGLYGPSIADIARVLQLNPNHFGAMSGLAIMLEDMGEPARALEIWRRIETIHPARPGLREAIGRLEGLSGEMAL